MIYVIYMTSTLTRSGILLLVFLMMVSGVTNSVQAWGEDWYGYHWEYGHWGYGYNSWYYHARQNGYQQGYSDGSNNYDTIVQDILQSIVLRTATVMLTDKLSII
jgi:hypothetical protein